MPADSGQLCVPLPIDARFSLVPNLRYIGPNVPLHFSSLSSTLTTTSSKFLPNLDAYTKKDLVYEWQSDNAVQLVPGMTLSQFDLVSMSQQNYTYKRREGDFSVVQVAFNLQRHTGYFLIQVRSEKKTATFLALAKSCRCVQFFMCRWRRRSTCRAY